MLTPSARRVPWPRAAPTPWGRRSGSASGGAARLNVDASSAAMADPRAAPARRTLEPAPPEPALTTPLTLTLTPTPTPAPTPTPTKPSISAVGADTIDQVKAGGIFKRPTTRPPSRRKEGRAAALLRTRAISDAHPLPSVGLFQSDQYVRSPARTVRDYGFANETSEPGCLGSAPDRVAAPSALPRQLKVNQLLTAWSSTV
jgi:hypothetical protein